MSKEREAYEGFQPRTSELHQKLIEARELLEKEGFAVVKKTVLASREGISKDLLAQKGYVVLKKKSYEDEQRKRRRAEALLSSETEHQKALYAWMTQHFVEERRLRDRLVFVYGVARAHGATVAELHSPEGAIQEAEQGDGLITEITIPELIVKGLSNGVYEDYVDPETNDESSRVVPGTEDFGLVELFVPVENLHLISFNKPVDLTVKVGAPEARDISTREPENQPAPMEPEGCLVTDCRNGHTHVCVRPQDHDGSHDFSCPKCDEDSPEGEACRLCLETGCTGGCVDPETAEELEDQLNNRFDEDDDFGMEPDDD